MAIDTKIREILIFAFLCLGAGLAVFVYWDGLYGPFLLDDSWNLSPLGVDGGISTFAAAINFVFSNVSGPLGRPISMFSFLINDQGWPGNEFDFKYTNLLIHILCGLVIYCISYKILKLSGVSKDRAQLFAVFVSVLWWVHPFNVSTVLYVIQRMTQLATLFSLLSIWFYLSARIRIQNNQTYGYRLFIVGVLPCIAFSVLSKESGVTTFFLILLIEWLYFSFKAPAMFRNLFSISIVLPTVVVFLYLIISNWDFERVYSRREFTVTERLLTETRVLFDYISYILFPKTIGTGLIHDDFILSRSWFDPISTLFSGIGLSVLLITSWLARVKFKLLSFGLLFFLLGHLLESTILPLEIYFEHRNYLPMIGLILVLVFIMDKFLDMESKNIGRAIVFTIFAFYIGGSSALTAQNVKIWSNVFDLLTFWATEHPDSLRAQRIYGQFLGKTEWYMTGIDVLTDAYDKFPKDIGLPLATLNIVCERGIAESPLKLEQINQDIHKARFNGGLITVAKNFGELYLSGKCASEETQKEVDAIFKELVKLPGMRSGARADLLFYHAESYATRGDLNNAMQLMEQAYKNQKVVVVPFRQAQMLASAGLYDEALGFIEKAYLADKLRPRAMLTKSEDHEIDQLKNMILRAKKNEP